MKIIDMYQQKKTVFSMEVFPPKREGDHRKLLEVIDDLKHLNPDFMSVTYGAGGSTRDMTLEISSEIKNDIGIESMAHLTCVGNSKTEISEVIDRLKEANIENILALRGDPPRGEEEFRPVLGGFRFAFELIDFIRREKNHFSVGVAAYPEKHPEAHSLEHDIDNLKIKLDKGGDFIITQLFFFNDYYYRFIEKARSMGVDAPVSPGVFLVSNYKQLQKIKELSGAAIPVEFEQKLFDNRDNPEEMKKIGVDYALNQSRDLLESGAVDGLHFYIMNRKDLIGEVYEQLKGYFH
jgi:methylenetetrahydrofolate reductase (NADPH)